MGSEEVNGVPNVDTLDQDVERSAPSHDQSIQRVNFRTRLAVIVEDFSFLWYAYICDEKWYVY